MDYLMLLGTGIGIMLSNIFHGKKEIPKHARVKVIALRKTVQQADAALMDRRETLAQHNKSLEGSLQKTQADLKVVKQKSLMLRMQLSNPDKTEQDNFDCSELQGKVNDMISVSNYQDSLREAVSGYLSAQLQNRDSVIQLLDAETILWKNTLESSFLQQASLEEQLRTVTKKNRRMRFAGKLRTVGFIIVAALAAKQFTE